MALSIFTRQLLSDEVKEIEEVIEEDKKDESFQALAILILMVVLITVKIIGHYLEMKKNTWISEASIALILGICIGGIVRLIGKDDTFQEWLTFQESFFFFVLLPPIIFEAGFSLNVKPFFKNIGAICAYALIGTVLSAFIIGIAMYLAGQSNLCFKTTVIEAMLFGTLISATDPVSVLAIFQRLGADIDLYTLIFGEAILNDAVAIVLYESLTKIIKDDITIISILMTIASFFEIFVFSMGIGVGFGFMASLIFKKRYLSSPNTPLEGSIVVLFALASFFTATAANQSGIVTILFCGIVMARYMRPNLSPNAEKSSIGFFKIVASLSESFVYIYIGTTLLLHKQAWTSSAPPFIVICLIVVGFARWANVWFNTFLINAFRTVKNHITKEYKYVMWFSGLRGAIAFALAIKAANSDFTSNKAEVGQVFLTTTFFIILITVCINGGFSAVLLEKYKLRNASNYYRLNEQQRQESANSQAQDLPSVVLPQKSPNNSTLEKIQETDENVISSKLQNFEEKYIAKFFIPVPESSHSGSSGEIEVREIKKTETQPNSNENEDGNDLEK